MMPIPLVLLLIALGVRRSGSAGYDLIDAAQPGPLAMLWATEKDPAGKRSELSAERAALIEEWASQSRDGLCGTNYLSERVDAFTRVYRPILERHK